MTSEKIKRMLDACYQAKRIRDLLPPLPEGVMPSYIQYLEKIQALEKQGIRVKVSDISAAMSLPRPGVTRTVTYISVTEAGKALSREYDELYFGTLSRELSGISEEEADCMIETIGKFYEIMCERRSRYDK